MILINFKYNQYKKILLLFEVKEIFLKLRKNEKFGMKDMGSVQKM